MLKLEEPTFGFNAHDVGFPHYKMWETIDAPRGADVQLLLDSIVRANRLALENQQKPLANIVLNCHGYPGRVWLGGVFSGFLDMSTLSALSVLKPKNLGTIWLTSCAAAKESRGKLFCMTLSLLTGCPVVASEASQEVDMWGAWRIKSGLPGLIDEMEGTVLRFTANSVYSRVNPHDLPGVK